MRLTDEYKNALRNDIANPDIRTFVKLVVEKCLDEIDALRSERDAITAGAYQAAADRIQCVVDAWQKRIQFGQYQGEALRCANVRRNEGSDLVHLISALTPADALREMRLREAKAVLAALKDLPETEIEDDQGGWAVVLYREVASRIKTAQAAVAAIEAEPTGTKRGDAL